MNTLAIWFERKDTPTVLSDIPSADFHFNLWKLKLNHKHSSPSKYNKRYGHFLDIGIKIKRINLVNKVFIYLPFQIKANSIKDLGKCLCSNPGIINVIFNENYKIIGDPNSKMINVRNSVNAESFGIYALDESQDLEIVESSYDNGSLIKMKVSDIIPLSGEVYFRIRIRGEAIENFRTVYQPKNSLFQSAFSNTEIIDFRLNEKRNLNKSLLEDMGKKGMFNINKIHFLLLSLANDDYIYSHKPADACRVLEKDIWKSYIGADYECSDNVIAYHWKEKGECSTSFSAMVKMRFDENNFCTILIYLGIFGVLSIIFNIVSNYIYTIFSNIK